MSDDIAKVSDEYYAIKYGDIDYLIQCFENKETWVFENEKAHKMLLDKLRGKNKRGRPRAKDKIQEHELWIRVAHITKALNPDLPWKNSSDYEGAQPSVCSILAKEFNVSSSQIYKTVVTEKEQYPEAVSLGQSLAEMYTDIIFPR